MEGEAQDMLPRSFEEGKVSAVADADAMNWVGRFAPKAWVPYLRLARVDRPIGTWLLVLPCFWAVGLATRSSGAAHPAPWLLLLFAIGAMAMRGAGCTYNDIIDREIDASVTRTRARPLPSGQVSVAQARAFMVALCLVGLAVLLSLNGFAIMLGLAVVPIVALYPFVKRFSYWPQAVLGFAFSWGALMGYAAVDGHLGLPAMLLYGGAVCWTIGYDTIYAHQDREDDDLIGLKSTALRFGRATRVWVALLYGVAWGAITLAGILAEAGTVFLLGMLLGGAQLVWQVATLDIDDPENCLRCFRANRDFGLIVLAAILLDTALARLF
jgi:4-hydroxybenzoate polyprenyltransferase